MSTYLGMCYQADALDPAYAYRIINYFEGTTPSPQFSLINLIRTETRGISYEKKTPIIVIRFQTHVVGLLDRITLINEQDNVNEFRVDLFDFLDNLVYSRMTIYPEKSIKILSGNLLNLMYISKIQIEILGTTDNLPVRHLSLSIVGCFSVVPALPTTPSVPTTTQPAPVTSTTTTCSTTTRRPRSFLFFRFIICSFCFNYF